MKRRLVSDSRGNEPDRRHRERVLRSCSRRRRCTPLAPWRRSSARWCRGETRADDPAGTSRATARLPALARVLSDRSRHRAAVAAWVRRPGRSAHAGRAIELSGNRRGRQRSLDPHRTHVLRTATASNGECAISSSARRVSRSGSCAGPERRLPGPGARCQWPTRSATRVKGHPHSPTGTSNPHLPPSPPRPPGPARASSSPLKRYSDNADGTCARRIRRQPIACA